MGKKPQFTWDEWDFDLDGCAFIIAKRECADKDGVPDYIIQADRLSPDCRNGMAVEEGWCKFQVRTDWENGDGEPRGGYVVETYEPNTRHSVTGKRKPGWFPVWIVRKGDWY